MAYKGEGMEVRVLDGDEDYTPISWCRLPEETSTMHANRMTQRLRWQSSDLKAQINIPGLRWDAERLRFMPVEVSE